jgi:hypothetical protein
MAISLTSWQSKPFQSEDIKSASIFKPGHEFNLDINIFRNSKLIGGLAAETLNLKDMYDPTMADYSRGHQEDARRSGILEFFDLINHRNTRGTSSLESHLLSSQIMSNVYRSLATKNEVQDKLDSTL